MSNNKVPDISISLNLYLEIIDRDVPNFNQ